MSRRLQTREEDRIIFSVLIQRFDFVICWRIQVTWIIIEITAFEGAKPPFMVKDCSSSRFSNLSVNYAQDKAEK
jgi:hypothetical protein